MKSKIKKTYYPNGQVKQEYHTVDGIKHGRYILYFENGQVELDYNYVYGVLHGLYMEWYENGQLAEEGEHINGDHQVKNFWDENGDQLLINGNGKTIRKFGFSDRDIYEQYFVNGEFTGEKKISGAIFIKFIPNEEL